MTFHLFSLIVSILTYRNAVCWTGATANLCLAFYNHNKSISHWFPTFSGLTEFRLFNFVIHHHRKIIISKSHNLWTFSFSFKFFLVRIKYFLFLMPLNHFVGFEFLLQTSLPFRYVGDACETQSRRCSQLTI